MISDADITKLKKVFATKEDLEDFATKKDLKAFATKKDLKAFATHEVVADLALEVGERFDKVEARMDSLDIKLDAIINKMDEFVGATNNIREDNAAGAHMLYRHERQLAFLADNAGVTLPE